MRFFIFMEIAAQSKNKLEILKVKKYCSKQLLFLEKINPHSAKWYLITFQR